MSFDEDFLECTQLGESFQTINYKIIVSGKHWKRQGMSRSDLGFRGSEPLTMGIFSVVDRLGPANVKV